MRKAYALLLTIVVVSILSYSTLYIFELKTMSHSSTKNAYLQTQAQLHLDFFSDYVKQLNLKKECYKHLKLDNERYNIYATFDYDCNNYQETTVHVFVKYSDTQNRISLHNEVILN